MTSRLCAQPGRYVAQCSFIIEHRYYVELARGESLDGRRCPHCGSSVELKLDIEKLRGIRDTGQRRGRDIFNTYLYEKAHTRMRADK